MTVKRTREQLTEEISAIEGVERVESVAESAFQKLTIYVAADAYLSGRVVDTIGRENIESQNLRDPTLEEAYINILQ